MLGCLAAVVVAAGVTLFLVCGGGFALMGLGSTVRTAPTQGVRMDGTGSSTPVAKERAVATTDTAELDGLQVQITEASVGRVELRHLGEKSQSEERLLIVKVRLRTANDTRKYDYRPWHGSLFGSPGATDNFGNQYKPIDFGFANTITGRSRADSVSAGSPLTDVLVFERPLDKAEYVDLDLPGENVGVKGTFRFRIPRTVWANK